MAAIGAQSWTKYRAAIFNKLYSGATTSTERFRGQAIAYFKGFSVISNGFFTEFHFVSWFVRYDRFKHQRKLDAI
jgi:hypothetical protein